MSSLTMPHAVTKHFKENAAPAAAISLGGAIGVGGTTYAAGFVPNAIAASLTGVAASTLAGAAVTGLVYYAYLYFFKGETREEAMKQTKNLAGGMGSAVFGVTSASFIYHEFLNIPLTTATWGGFLPGELQLGLAIAAALGLAIGLAAHTAYTEYQAAKASESETSINYAKIAKSFATGLIAGLVCAVTFTAGAGFFDNNWVTNTMHGVGLFGAFTVGSGLVAAGGAGLAAAGTGLMSLYGNRGNEAGKEGTESSLGRRSTPSPRIP